MPAAAPVLRPEFAPGLLVLVADVVVLGVSVEETSDVEALGVGVLLSGGNVTPALANASSGAEAGAKLSRSDSCHATEIGLAKAVVPAGAEECEFEKLRSVTEVVRT